MKDFVKNREPFCSLQGSEVTVRSGGGFPPMLLCQNLDVRYLKEQNLILGSWDKKFLLLSWLGELMAKKKAFSDLPGNTDSCQGTDWPLNRVHFPLMVQQTLNHVFYFICTQFGVKLSPFHEMTPASAFIIASGGRQKMRRGLDIVSNSIKQPLPLRRWRRFLVMDQMKAVVVPPHWVSGLFKGTLLQLGSSFQ